MREFIYMDTGVLLVFGANFAVQFPVELREIVLVCL